MSSTKEVWKDIPGYEGHYKISSLGRVKSLTRIIPSGDFKRKLKSQVIKSFPDRKGYSKIELRKYGEKSTHMVHDLMVLVFMEFSVDSLRKFRIKHLNQIKTDNRLENLQLVSKGSSIYIGVHWDKSREEVKILLS